MLHAAVDVCRPGGVDGSIVLDGAAHVCRPDVGGSIVLDGAAHVCRASNVVADHLSSLVLHVGRFIVRPNPFYIYSPEVLRVATRHLQDLRADRHRLGARR